jgi:DNA-directed RNA polymerase subunit RPC12/RpoP
MELVVIKTFDNFFSANISLTKLQDAGIACYLKDEYTVTVDPILCNAIGGIKLVVKAQDGEAAMVLVQQFDREYLEAVQCPKCSAKNFMQITKPGVGNYLTAILTWLFASYSIAPQKVYQCQSCGYESETLPSNSEEEN